MRPKTVTFTAWLMVISNLVGYGHAVLLDPSTPRPLTRVVFVIVTGVHVAAFVPIWFYARGRNWARWLVLLASCLTLYNLRNVPGAGLFTQGKLLSQAALGAFLLYWLNTPSAKIFFAGMESTAVREGGAPTPPAHPDAE